MLRTGGYQRLREQLRVLVDRGFPTITGIRDVIDSVHAEMTANEAAYKSMG